MLTLSCLCPLFHHWSQGPTELTVAVRNMDAIRSLLLRRRAETQLFAPQLKSAGCRPREYCGVGGGRGHSLQISLLIASTEREGGREGCWVWSLLRTVRQGCDKQHKARGSHDTGGVGGLGWWCGGVGVVRWWGHIQEITHKRSAPVAPSIWNLWDIVRLLHLNAGYFLNDGNLFR